MKPGVGDGYSMVEVMERVSFARVVVFALAGEIVEGAQVDSEF